jgi:hypothetical protein
MKDVHTDPPGAGDAEVAELCFHAGVSISTDYGIFSSASSEAAVEYALENHFRYDPDVREYNLDIAMMIEELQWSRPLIFNGRDFGADSGHAWVVTGYDRRGSDTLFGMNFGWNGEADGWYACDKIDWDEDGEWDFTVDQDHVARIAPVNMVRFVGAADPGDGSPSDPHQNIEEAVASAPNNATLVFRAGSDNTFPNAPLVIDRPMTLRGLGVVIRKE